MSFQSLALAASNSSALARPVAQPTVAPKVDAVAQAKVVTSRPVAPSAPVAPAQSTDPSVMEELSRLRAENAQMKEKIARAGDLAKMGISLKVSEKGALSLYGLGKFPTTLYAEQWLKIFAIADVVKEFIATNRSALKDKETK